MKKQSFKSREHEHAGMAHHSHHKAHPMKKHKSSHALYENETERPHVPAEGHNEPMMNLSDFKGDAMDTAYGQAGKAGCGADEKKIHGQFKNYGWDANTGY